MGKSKSNRIGQPHHLESHEKSSNKVMAENVEGRSFEDLFNEAVELYQKAVSGHGKSLQKAIDIFKDLRNQKHGDNVLEAYCGASYLLMGKYEKNPMNKEKWIKDGLQIIDKAQNNDPNNVKVRILRGYSCYHLPAYFNRISTTIEDFEYLLSRREKDPRVLSDETFRKISSDVESARKKYKPYPRT